MGRNFIICILHLTVFSGLMSTSLMKTLACNSASYISFGSKSPNWFVPVTSIRILYRLRLSLIVYSWSSACCRQFTMPPKSSSRPRIKEMIWSSEPCNVLINTLSSDKALNGSVWHFWKGWSKSAWSFARSSRISHESKFCSKFRPRNTKYCVKRLRTGESDSCRVLTEFESRTAKSLPECRELAALFQAVFLSRLIEQDHDNIPRILDSIRSGSYLQPCGESEHDPSWSPLTCHELECLPLLMPSGRGRSTARILQKKAIEHRMHGWQCHKTCRLRSSQQYWFSTPNWAIENGPIRFHALGRKWASMIDCTGLNQESALRTSNVCELWVLDEGQTVLPQHCVLVWY